MFPLKPSARKNISLGLINGIAVKDTSLSPTTSFMVLLLTTLTPKSPPKFSPAPASPVPTLRLKLSTNETPAPAPIPETPPTP